MADQADLVLITGATGFLGYLVLIEALKAGYRVRIAIRSESKLQNVLNAPSFKALKPQPDGFSWVIVPDMAVPGAYDDAVKGVKYIIHVASSIPTFGAPNAPGQDEYEAYFVKPAVAGDLGMLRSAAKEASVKRVVLTSSVAATTPFEYYAGKGDATRVFTAADRIPFAKGPWESEFDAYSSGKAAALNAAEDFVKSEKPDFDLIPIIPGWIFGRDELITRADGLRNGSTNSVLLGFLTGGKNDIPFHGKMVLGQDVAKIHVLALNPAVKGNRALLATIDAKWADAQEVLKDTKYAKAIADGKLSLEGKQDTLEIKMPSTETEEVLEFQFKPFEEMVKQVADQYIELSA